MMAKYVMESTVILSKGVSRAVDFGHTAIDLPRGIGFLKLEHIAGLIFISHCDSGVESDISTAQALKLISEACF